jgi:chromosome partitioning protein
LTEVLAIANQKGGVGKTTTSINLGAALAAHEVRVLVVDCDPQGNATRGLGVDPSPPTTYQVLLGEVPAEQAVRPTGFPLLDILPADRELVGIEVEFAGTQGWHFQLKEALAPLLGAYDWILIDCPPSLGHLTVLALVGAGQVFVPLQCEYFALEGLSELLATVRRLSESIRPELELRGILLTMQDERTNLSREVEREVREHFGPKVFKTVIPRNVRLAEAPSYGRSILQYDIKSRGAEAYLALARELLTQHER